MDFWSRLIRGAGSTSPKKATNVSSHHQRLAHFKRTYNTLLQIWHNGDIASKDTVAAENVRICLRRLAEVLSEDVRGPVPHLCIAFVATSSLLIVVSRVASAFRDHGVIREALNLCSILIDSEEEDFLGDRGFADALTAFVSGIASSGAMIVDIETHNMMTEIVFGIASRIRMQPRVLSIWYRPRQLEQEVTDTSGASGDSVKRSRKEDFPLFYILLDHVHYEGRAGEFARMGVLYIIESAACSEDLEKWLIESDMATLMASGLGALYSQLSRKLVFTYSKENLPVILAGHQETRIQPKSDAEETTSPEFQAHLETFLSSLIFWQDVLEHCSSFEVKRTLLDHFQYLFLQQLLYPSLLESSDVDGGSSVAVLTYMRCILESIDHPDLIHLILQYLLALPEQLPEPKSIRPTTLARRRKSQNLLTHLANGDDKPAPSLFNLVDLILASLKSKNQQTITATLRLLSTLLRRQHNYIISKLIKTHESDAGFKRRTLDDYEQERNHLLHMSETLDDGPEVESFETHLQDVRNLIETHPCSVQILALPDLTGSGEISSVPPTGRQLAKPVKSHAIASDDPLLKSLLVLLERFLLNDIETNLSLTQAFTDLASCGYTHMEGWLLAGRHLDDFSSNRESKERAIGPRSSSPNAQDVHRVGGSGEAAEPIPTKTSLQNSRLQVEDSSAFFKTLDSLVQRVETYRHDVENFDNFLAERRRVFFAQEGVGGAKTNTPALPRRSEDFRNASASRVQNINQIRSISERLQSDQISESVSRSSSPRGRQPTSTSTPTVVGRLSHVHRPPSRSPSQATSGRRSPSQSRQNSSLPASPIPGYFPSSLQRALQHKIKVEAGDEPKKSRIPEPLSSESSSIKSEAIESDQGPERSREITLSQLLTNIVILQEFMLELVALIDVRASLFGEVKFR